MAEKTPSKQETEAFQKQADQLRIDLGAANVFVEAQKLTQTASAFTIEDALDGFIERMSGKPPLRPNALERIAQMKSSLDVAIAKTKAISPESFVQANEETNVNTRP